MLKILAMAVACILFFAIASTNNINNAAAKSGVAKEVAKYDLVKNCATDQHTILNPITYLTHFSCGHVTILDNGTTLRQFSLVVKENTPIEIAQNISFPGWTFNGSIPAPTIRVTEGDHVKITVINDKNNTHNHSLHLHSMHPGAVDGTMLNGASGSIAPGHNYTYNFVAAPMGVYPFHCHVDPIAQHINHGLYGAMIIDPPSSKARVKMTEMMMFLNGYDLEYNEPYPSMITPLQAAEVMKGEDGNKTVIDTIPGEHDNAIYSVNGKALEYLYHPIQLKVNEKVRAYIVNMLDFEPNSFHLHGQVFKYYPAGTSKTPDITTDIVTLTQGDRGIAEFNFKFPGNYMFHAHEDQIASRGWMGYFSVK